MKIGFEPVMAVQYLAVSATAVFVLTLVLIVQYLLWSDFSIRNSEVLSINDLNLWSALLVVLN